MRYDARVCERIWQRNVAENLVICLKNREAWGIDNFHWLRLWAEQGDKSSTIIDSDHTCRGSSMSHIEVQSTIKSNRNSRHHADLSEQSGVPHAVEVRLTKSGRRQDTTAHLVRRGLIACDGNGSFGEQHASQSVHAAVVSHAAHNTLRVAWVGDIGMSDGTPFDVFFAGFPASLSVRGAGRRHDRTAHSLVGPSPG